MRDLVNAVAASALVPVVGKSGVGKSSLVQAGLLPKLEQTGWAVETILPRPSLPMALAAALTRLSGAQGSGLDTWQDYLARHGLAAAAEKARKDREDREARKDPAGSTWQRAVIVIDQFEEALAREGESDPVLRQLGALRDGALLTLVLTLREDSFGALFVSHKTFGERLRRSAIPLRGMDRHELTDAIRLPAEWYGCDVTDPLVEELIEAVGDNPGALPLLEFSLDQMWRALPRGEDRLSSDDERRIRGLAGVLAAHADQVLNSLSADEQAMVRNLFVNHLTSVEQPDLRRVIRLSDCDPRYGPVIGRLADERLLTVGSDEDGHQTAEVVHEALLRAWNQLHVWLDAEGEFRRWRQRLREDLRSWRETGDSSELLTGRPLAHAERWRSDRKADLDVDELRFIRASAERRDEQEDHYRTLYNRARARDLTHRAESAEDPHLALRYALELIELSPDPPACRLVRACLHRVGAWDIDVSTDRRVAALDYDRRLRVWDLETQHLLCESVTDLGVSRIAFDEDYVAAGEVGTGASGRFPVHPNRLQEQARQAVNGELTAEELAEIEDPLA